MKKPQKRGPAKGFKAKRLAGAHAKEKLKAVADAASYHHSNYHCRINGVYASRGKPASRCPDWWTIQLATNAVRSAIREGSVSWQWVDEGRFPLYVWYNHDGTWYEGRTDERSRPGVYHGYPVDEQELPFGLNP